MPAILRHFAINAADVQKAKAFYETIFGWTFAPYGPPNFYQVWNAGSGFIGALQERRELAVGKPVTTFETSFQVEDIRATLKAVEANGGRVLMQPYFIEGVGVGQYLPGIWK
jgi:uncharacterized protein